MSDTLIIGIVVGIVALVAIVWGMVSEIINHDSGVEEIDLSDQQDLDWDTKLMLGIMGAKMLDERFEKEKKEREKRNRDLFQWQESIREQNPDIDGEDESWL